jgi:hypothetical protein
MVTHDREKAISLRDSLEEKGKHWEQFRVEEWQDGDTDGTDVS